MLFGEMVCLINGLILGESSRVFSKHFRFERQAVEWHSAVLACYHALIQALNSTHIKVICVLRAVRVLSQLMFFSRYRCLTAILWKAAPSLPAPWHTACTSPAHCSLQWAMEIGADSFPTPPGSKNHLLTSQLFVVASKQGLQSHLGSLMKGRCPWKMTLTVGKEVVSKAAVHLFCLKSSRWQYA